MNYCWLIRVREDGKAIQEVTGYYDTAMVNALLQVPPLIVLREPSERQESQ